MAASAISRPKCQGAGVPKHTLDFQRRWLLPGQMSWANPLAGSQWGTAAPVSGPNNGTR